jgi:hypothetical protein
MDANFCLTQSGGGIDQGMVCFLALLQSAVYSVT